MRIVLVIHSLERGGAERVISTMANYWAAKSSHEIVILTIAGQELDTYQLSGNIKRVSLQSAGTGKNIFTRIANNFQRMFAMRRALKQISPGVVVSFTTNVNCLTVLALAGMDIPVIISERIDPDFIQVGAFRKWLCTFLYPRASLLVVQTKRAGQIMQTRYPDLPVAVLPNPIQQHDPDQHVEHVPLRVMLGLSPDIKIIAGMGRLGREKGFDLLIKAFDEIAMDHPNWQLVIFGEGAYREELERQIKVSNLKDQIHLPGAVRSPRKYLAECNIFVLSSRYEGFPNVLLEAMACGLPVVSFACASGPSEIIRNSIDGILLDVENVPALEQALVDLMESDDLRRRLGIAAQQAVQRFSTERVMQLWEDLISVSGKP
jgi:GalNAc-alpha-(1->4)-GalNAc-alpha-(1->3)-diNAcBac-PP-undecaprenol alpha-1,4-N-acetyl-D-galactosaminyltransferase